MAEDAASVLEQFVQDVANLPAEIAHLLEEIQAKDQAVVKLRKDINKNDTSIQQHLKSQDFNCSNPHPKDKVYCDAVCSYFDKAQTAQNEKVALSDKAALLLDRQIKRLDFKIRDLQNEGAIQPDPQLPSLLTNTSLSTRLPPLSSNTTGPGSNTPLHPLSGNAGPSTTIANNPIQRLVQPAAGRPSHRHPSPLASSVPANAIAAHNIAAGRHNHARSPSTDTTKRRRMNPHHPGNLPAQSSSLRQSSMGPGTPKGVDGASRGSSAGPTANRPTKKGGPSARGAGAGASTAASAAPTSTASHARINALSTASSNTTHPNKKSTTSSSRKRGTKKSNTPASSADIDSDPAGASASASEEEDSRMEDVEEEPEDGEDDEDEGADDRKYCVCKQVSFGNMVACDNEGKCPYEWFHWSCVGIKAEPDGKWFCPDCRVRTREGREWAAAEKAGGRGG